MRLHQYDRKAARCSVQCHTKPRCASANNGQIVVMGLRQPVNQILAFRQRGWSKRRHRSVFPKTIGSIAVLSARSQAASDGAGLKRLIFKKVFGSSQYTVHKAGPYAPSRLQISARAAVFPSLQQLVVVHRLTLWLFVSQFGPRGSFVAQVLGRITLWVELGWAVRHA